MPMLFLTHTGTTNETAVCASACRLHSILPQAATAGTVTLRNDTALDGGTSFHVAAAALPVAGKDFKGIQLDKGLTVQLSNGADVVTIIYEKL